MSNARLISPKVNLVDEVIHSIRRDGKDFSDTIIIFPGKRPAHVLRRKLSELIGASFIPPKIFSIDIFIDFLFIAQLGQRPRTIDPLDASAILYSLHKQLPRETQLSEQHFMTLDAFYPLAQKIYTELEELFITSVTPHHLRDAAASVSLSSTQTLVALYDAFYRELDSRGIATRSMKYRYVAEHANEIDLSSYSSIIIAGFYAFTHSEVGMIRNLLSRDNVEAIFQNGVGIQAQLQKVGLELQSEGEAAQPEYHFYQSPDAHGELFALNSILSKNLPAMVERSDDSVIVMPSSENLFPLYHQTLSAYDQSTYNIALGYPLTRTPVYGFLMAMMDVLVSSRDGAVFVPKYVQFLLHPYTKNILYGNRSDVTRMLVHAVEEYCTEHRTQVFVTLEEIERSPEVFTIVQRRIRGEDVELSGADVQQQLMIIHDSTLRKFLAIQSIGDLGRTCVDVLQFIHERSTAHRHPFFRPFVETLLQHLETLQHSLIAGERFEKFEHTYAFLKQYIAEAEVPFTGTPLQGLQVLGFLETRGLQFNTVYILDVNDDVIPGGTQQDVLLPLKIREQLGLSTYKDQERIKAYIFELICGGAENVHFFFIDNAGKTKSRLIEQLLWQKQHERRSLDVSEVKQLRYAIDLRTQPPDEVQKTESMIEQLKEMPFSSTALDTYLTCQLQFYYRYVLRLREKDDVSGDVEQFDVGSLIHTVLEEFYLPVKEKKLTVEELDVQRLEVIVNQTFERYYGNNLLGEQFFTKRQIVKHLREYVENVQLPLVKEQSINVERLEENLTAEVSGFKFQGKADRIEKRNGTTFILDYKSGSDEKRVRIAFKKLDDNDRTTWETAIGSVQLPLYMMMYSRNEQLDVKDIVPKIIFLGKRILDDKTEFGLFESQEEAAEWYPKLERIILSMVKEITDIRQPFIPTEDIDDDCPSCPFKFICGTQWIEKFTVY